LNLIGDVPMPTIDDKLTPTSAPTTTPLPMPTPMHPPSSPLVVEPDQRRADADNQ